MENEIYNFWKFISRYSIVMPSLQRDFAQGRDDAKAVVVRKQFVKSLFGQLTWGKSEGRPSDLNFIYGRTDRDSFMPYDGQQRLTTLFLLHVYLLFARKCFNGIPSEAEDLEFKNDLNVLGKFSYCARESTSDFLQQLREPRDGNFIVEQLFTDSRLAIDPDGHACRVQDYIVDQPFFRQEWTRDPTIMGMLRMLDEIHVCFRGIVEKMRGVNNPECFCEKMLPQAWEQIKSPSVEKSPFRFHFLQMNDAGIRDDIYRKMNARGLPLSDSENFKVSFEKFLVDSNAGASITAEIVEGIDVWDQLPFHKKIICRFDRVWVESFWKRYRSELAFTTLMQFVARFFHAYAVCALRSCDSVLKECKTDDCELRKKEAHRAELQSAADELDELARGKASYLQFNSFELVLQNYGAEELVCRFVAFMDKISRVISDDASAGTNKWPKLFCREGWVSRNFSGDFLLPNNDCQRAILGVVALFDWRKGDGSINEWIRLAWNLADRNVYDPTSSENLIAYFNECSASGSDVLVFLRDGETPSFFKQTFKEEQFKAKMFLKDNRWHDLICQAEQNPYVHASIGFLFDDYPDQNAFQTTEDAFVCRVGTMNRIFGSYENETGETKELKAGVAAEYRGILLRAVVANFNAWDQLLNFNYDQTCDETWYRFFREEKYLMPMRMMLQKVFENDVVSLEQWVLGLTKSDFSDLCVRRAHEDLYKSRLVNWLSVHQKNCSLHWHRGACVLYPANAKSDNKKFVIGTLRNELLSAKDVRIIPTKETLDKQLKDDDVLLPYFRGYELGFSYDGRDLIWHEDGRITDKEGRLIDEKTRELIVGCAK